jgi:hypothetical protein
MAAMPSGHVSLREARAETSRATHLSLSFAGLDELPPYLLEFPNLRRIELSHNCYRRWRCTLREHWWQRKTELEAELDASRRKLASELAAHDAIRFTRDLGVLLPRPVPPTP